MAQSFLTSTSAAIQAYSVPSDWNAANNSVAGIGPGGNGSTRQSSTRAGIGGGAGSYSIRANIDLTGSTAIYYFLPAAGSASDAWFNDLNLLQATTNNIGTSPWSTGGDTFSQSQADPVGGSVATKLIESSANEEHFCTQTLSKPASTSIVLGFLLWVKANGSRNVELGMFDNAGTNGAYAFIDLSNGNVHSTATAGSGWSAQSATVTSAGSGWYRIFFKATTNTATTSWRPYFESTDLSYNDSYLGDGSSGLFIYGANATYGAVDKGFTPTTSAAVYSLLCKAGTNATTSAAGVGQAGSVGDTTAQGGNGNQPALAVTVGGGGGGAAGPSGAGGDAVTSVGGTANNATTAGGLAGNNGNAGTEFDGSHGSGSGAGGRSGAGAGFVGGAYGGGGSGAGTTSGNAGGAGSAPIFVINYTAASADTLFAQSVM